MRKQTLLFIALIVCVLGVRADDSIKVSAGVKAEFSYGILKQGTRADGTRGKLYNDEPQIAVGIVYAGFYQL